MPSLSTSSVAAAALPAPSSARASNRSAPPGAMGSEIGTVARHVLAWGEPVVRVAATPFTLTAVTPTTSVVCTTMSAVEADSSTSGDGDVISTDGPVVSRTITGNVPDAELPAASVAAQFTNVVPSANPLPDAGTHETGVGPVTGS